MTHEEAGRVIAIFVKAYPTQARDEAFLSLMAAAMRESVVTYARMATRALSWIAKEPWWPAISDMLAPPDDDRQPVALIAPANPIPTEQGLEILRRAIQ